MLNRIVCTALLLLAASSTSAEEFQFFVLGNAPYGFVKKVYAPFEILIDTINQGGPYFVIHVVIPNQDQFRVLIRYSSNNYNS